MKAAFLALLLANMVAGAWLLLGTPVDVVREPGRVDLQVEPARLRVLTDAEFARKRDLAQSEAIAAMEAKGAAAAAATATAAIPEMPLASCIDIGTFTSEAGARKLRTRLTAAGLGDRLSATTDSDTHLHLTGLDAASEAQIHQILRDFPKLEIVHCSDAAAAR